MSTVREAVLQAVGHASVCWVGGPGNAVFDQQEAVKVADDLIEVLGLDPDESPAGLDGLTLDDWNRARRSIGG